MHYEAGVSKVRVRFEGGPGIVARLIAALDQIGAATTSLSAQFEGEGLFEAKMSDAGLAERFAHKVQSLWGVISVAVLPDEAQSDFRNDGAAKKGAEEDQ
jgi:hypothetical protein